MKYTNYEKVYPQGTNRRRLIRKKNQNITAPLQFDLFNMDPVLNPYGKIVEVHKLLVKEYVVRKCSFTFRLYNSMFI